VSAEEVLIVGYEHYRSLILNTLTGKVTHKTKLRQKRSWCHRLTICNKHVYCLGGHDGLRYKDLDAVEVYTDG